MRKSIERITLSLELVCIRKKDQELMNEDSNWKSQSAERKGWPRFEMGKATHSLSRGHKIRIIVLG